MKQPIINCDVGEGVNNEAELMPYIQFCNIACGGHAGDEEAESNILDALNIIPPKIALHIFTMLTCDRSSTKPSCFSINRNVNRYYGSKKSRRCY
jgi:hypothetical protein